MTTAHIVEVTIDGKISYMTNGGNLVSIPKFFNGAPRVKRLLEGGHRAQNWRMNPDLHPHTKVITIRNLELGLKASHATIYTVEEFLKRDFSNNGLRIPNNPNAIYMIQYGKEMSLSDKPRYVKLAAQGRKHKFGHQWNHAGHLRSHISGRLHRLDGDYRGATVVEIEMQDDGFTPKQVKTYPIVDFYCASQSCRVNYNLHTGTHKPYTPSSPEYA